MEITVQNIYELQALKTNMDLLAGEGGLERVVTSVSVMEVPDFADASLAPGLFVLTTLYNFSKDENQMVEVIRKLSENQVSGIAIKINRFLDSIPSRIIEEADKRQLPLFCVQGLLFSNMISLISSEIINNEFNKIKTANEHYQEVFLALLNGEKIASFTKKTGKKMNCSCACVSGKGLVLAQYFREDFDRTKIKQDYYDRLLEKVFQVSGDKMEEMSDFRFEDCYVFPCRLKRRSLGYFIVWSVNELTEYEILLSQQMKNFLSMKFMEEYAIETDQRRRVSSILDEILYGKNNKVEVIKERLYLLGFKENRAFRVLLFSISEKENQWETEVLLRNIQTQFPGAVAYFIMEGFAVICPTAEDSTASTGENKRFKGRVGEAMRRMKLECKVGCSTKQNDLRKISQCLSQAKQALSYGHAFDIQENIYCYENYSEISAISYMLGTEGETQIYRTVIDPIMEYDKNYNQQLWDTLVECLSTNTLEAAAKSLHIHSSTLRYRLQNICNITGYDFFNNIGKYVLNTAYILYKLT